MDVCTTRYQIRNTRSHRTLLWSFWGHLWEKQRISMREEKILLTWILLFSSYIFPLHSNAFYWILLHLKSGVSIQTLVGVSTELLEIRSKSEHCENVRRNPEITERWLFAKQTSLCCCYCWCRLFRTMTKRKLSHSKFFNFSPHRDENERVSDFSMQQQQRWREKEEIKTANS